MAGTATETSTPQVQSRLTPKLALLADHLDAVLRHGEALRVIELPGDIAAFDGPGVPAMLRRGRQADAAIGEAHALELAIILRMTQARTTAEAARRDAGGAAGTLLRLVATAAAQVAQGTTVPTANGRDLLASRGIGRDATTIGEGYLIGGTLALGDVMDAAAAALDLIDTLGEVTV